MRAATFTTYINAQTDPGLEQAFNRQTQIATSSYATITRAAEQATRATAGLLGGRGVAGAGQGTQAIQQRASAVRAATTAAAEGERASIRLATATRREAEAVSAAARQHRQLAGSLTTTATALSVVSGRLDPVSSRVSTLARAMTDLTGVQLGLAAAGATLFALGRTASTFSNLEARVRPFYATQTQVNAAMNDIIGIAQRSRSALEPVVDVYTRLTTVGQNIGLSRGGIAQITEIATKAAAVGGGTAQARDAALMQFGQALSGDFKAAGQEINSLKEQAPVLFQAILRGYKDVDGTIGVTLGRFKQMAEAGELSTAKVLDAVRRSASYIDTMAARVPNTLSRAGTDFGNSLTITIGRFDQAVGFTSTLADSISLVAKYLRVIISLGAGVATAFAAIKLGGLVTEGALAVRTFITMRSAVTELGVRRQANAAASAAQHQREVAALNAEQAEIRESIVLLERQRAVAARDVQRYQPGPGFAGSPRRAAAAADEESKAVRGLIQQRQRLSIIQAATVTANTRAAASTETLARATANVTNRVGLFRSVGGSLVSFLGGPWGIAFAVATTAVYLLATAESAAEKATRQHEDAQRSFANVIDRSTGKIYDQVDALQRLNIAKKNSEDIDTSYKGAKAAQGQIVDLLRGVTRPVDRNAYLRAAAGAADPITGRVDPRLDSQLLDGARGRPQSAAQRKLDDALESFRRGEGGSYTRLANTVTELKNAIPGLAALMPRLGELTGRPARNGEEGTGFLGSYSRLRQGRAAQRVLQNRAQEGDVALALGEEPMTVRGTTKPRSKAQIEAAARAESAQTELQRARANLAEVRANGKTPGEDDVAYQHRLAQAMQAVTVAQQNQSAARKADAAGRAQARKDARDAIQDARDEAGAKRDAALLELSKRGLNPTGQEFLQARIAILKTYDDEVNKLDASRAASSTAASQMIADANKVAAAAASAGEKRRDILSQYDEAPKALDQAADRIDDLQRFVDTAVDGVAFIGRTKAEIAEIQKMNPLGTGIYTQEMADADARRINDGVRKPLRDMMKEYERAEEVARLQLQGRDAEASALQRRNSLIDSGITLEEGEYDALIRNERQQLRINDALASRQRVVSQITGALDSARDIAEGVFTSIQTGGDIGETFKGAFNDFRNQFARIQSRQLVEKLFAGSDEKLRALLEGKSSVDTAIDRFGTSIDTLTTSTTRVESSADRIATALENAAGRVDGLGGGAGEPVPTGAGAGSPVLGSNGFGAIAAAGMAIARQAASGGTSVGPNGEVVVTANPRKPQVPLPQSQTPSARQVYNTIGSGLFKPLAGALDGIVNKVTGAKTTRQADGTLIGGSTFFKKIGDSFGTALEGAGKGAIASGFAQALGIKQSQTGAAIGGGIGQLAFGPIGGIVGGLLGGTIGGLFQKPKSGSATITSVDQAATLAGNKDIREGLSGTSKSVQDGIQKIADALGADVGAFSVSIGKREDYFRVSGSGSANVSAKHPGSVLYDGKDEAKAIEIAIKDALADGAIKGISGASQRILQSGQDLQRAINKALVIESIPKRLLQITDPVRYAVTTLNDEFSKMIAYLKEGGATAEQFADAQKLYDLERQRAIEQATNQAAAQINQFLKDMVGGSSSPLNKRTTYENASKDLTAFKSDIAAGKMVDQNELLSAARNFQDASRALNGSSKSFFDDFDMLRGLLEKARDNAGITDVTTLPASPFANDASVQSAIASLQSSQVSATQAQTDAINGKLDELIRVAGSSGGIGYAADDGYRDSSVRLLPGFAQEKRFAEF